MEVWPGQPYPLGAIYDGMGTNFTLFSEVADRVELCLFGDDGVERRLDMPDMDGYVWHCFLPGISPGQRYGYRVHGPHDPAAGLRCNPAKLLLDPYTREVAGEIKWGPAVYGYPLGGDDREREDTDSAPFVPRSVVTSPWFEWGDDHPPRIPWNETVVYECHVKGLTMRHPDVPQDLRGTYAGMAHPAVIEHLRRLGVTAVELMPVHQFVQDHALADRGLRNYWGYNSIGFFAPHNEYSAWGAGDIVAEFKYLVKTLHEAGIEVILDVVYNHTAEGNHLGPVLSFKGIDNQAYYRLADERYYFDTTGTGNTLNMRHPHVLQMIVDSLRYWVTEMHVDGFRFDLAATLARQFHEVDRLSAFFDLIQVDPVVSQVKLIAEPWDLGEGGYQVGNFPPLWTEWNGRYRDMVRDYWRGADNVLPDLAYRLTGSSDLYGRTGRRPYASVNFVTAHDGFTLTDLVSYDSKHNEANGEDNRDGTDDNRSWNSGAEGPSRDPGVNEIRNRRRRALMATLLLSQGVPMLRHGDEIGHTQRGNNNAYCQDNELSWLDWEHADEEFLGFCAELVAFRRQHPVFRRPRFFEGRPIIGGDDLSDICWFRPDAAEMTTEDWQTGFAKSISVVLNGDALPDLDRRGQPLTDDTFLLLLNAHHEDIAFELPDSTWGERWQPQTDTTGIPPEQDVYPAGAKVFVAARSAQLLRRV